MFDRIKRPTGKSIQKNKRQTVPESPLQSLQSLLTALTKMISAVEKPGISPAKQKVIRKQIHELTAHLTELSHSLDPVRQPTLVFDPTDQEQVGRLVALALLEQPKAKISTLTRFYGSGVYAIYYKGKFPAYKPICATDHPIYVGKADPAISEARTPTEQGEKLSQRLREHLKSIRAAENLKEDDFECRYLVVKSNWQSSAERILIGRFLPIWNTEIGICKGFGKHGDSHETRANTRSPWDTLHPGRPWASRDGNRPNALSAAQIEVRIAEHYKENPPLKELQGPKL